MEAFKNLSNTNKILVLMGVIGIPFCTYVLYQDFAGEPKQELADTEQMFSNEPSLLLPDHKNEKRLTEVESSKVDVYEETLNKKERAERESKQVEDPFKEIMDENFFSTEPEVSQEEDKDLDERYEEWLAERETKETNRKSLTTKQTKERVRVTIQESSRKEPEVVPETKDDNQFSFYSKGSTNQQSNEIINDTETIRALVHNEQVVTNNSPLRIRILEDVVVSGVDIPKNSIIWGNVSFGRDRVRVSFSTVDISGNLISFSKEAYGKDGMEGIPLSEIPGAEGIIEDARDDRISDLERRRGVVGDVASGLNSLSNNTTKITFRDGHPFYLR